MGNQQGCISSMTDRQSCSISLSTGCRRFCICKECFPPAMLKMNRSCKFPTDTPYLALYIDFRRDQQSELNLRLQLQQTAVQFSRFQSMRLSQRPWMKHLRMAGQRRLQSNIQVNPIPWPKAIRQAMLAYLLQVLANLSLRLLSKCSSQSLSTFSSMKGRVYDSALLRKGAKLPLLMGQVPIPTKPMTRWEYIEQQRRKRALMRVVPKEWQMNTRGLSVLPWRSWWMRATCSSIWEQFRLYLICYSVSPGSKPAGQTIILSPGIPNPSNQPANGGRPVKQTYRQFFLLPLPSPTFSDFQRPAILWRLRSVRAWVRESVSSISRLERRSSKWSRQDCKLSIQFIAERGRGGEVEGGVFV